jgi:hypothetical protein
MKICWSGHQCVPPHSLSFTFYIQFVPLASIVAQGHSLAIRPHQPTSHLPHWLAALDVFNTADNLPCQTNGNTNSDSDFTSSIDGWRVAIPWDYMLIALAYKVNSSPPQKSQLSRVGP